LTLFTTPVIYLGFSRLGTWLAGLRKDRPAEQLNLPEVPA
jgi:hypothetical protein